MENIKETNEEQEVDVNAIEEEIIKSEQSQQQLQQDDKKSQQHQEQQQQEEQQENAVEGEDEEEADKQIETPGEKPTQQQQRPQQQEIAPQLQQQQETQAIDYAVEEEEDEDDDDDDEEKETSQKLVIDIPEDEEEEEEEEDDEEDDDEVIALDDLPPPPESNTKENDKISPKPEEVEAIITLSDGEEDIPITEVTSKPGKVQKRRSMGAGTVTNNNEEERYRLKRRKINVAGAPKMPLTGYVRYMNDRRESLRKEHPTKTAMEHTKMIGEEWHALPSDVKSSYLKAADADKQRYVKELHSFLKSRPDILASELAKNKIRKTAENNSPNTAAAATVTTTTANTTTSTKSLAKEKPTTNDNIAKSTKEHIKDKMSKDIMSQPSTSQQAAEKAHNEKNKRKRTPTPPTATANINNANPAPGSSSSNINATTSSTTSGISIVTPTPGEIPIFTNEFLEHNKIYDMELRSLRKSKTDLEQQNSVLEKHVENMKFGVEKMITENNELEEKNRLLEIYLDKLKRKLALALSSLPLPSAPNGATVDNIDKYMQDLYKMSTSNSHGPATLNKAKDIIRKLDLQIQL